MAWNEPSSVEAVRQYVRIISGLLFFLLLLHHLFIDKIDVETMMSVIAALVGMERLGQAAINHQQAKAREKEIQRMLESIPDLTRD